MCVRVCVCVCVRACVRACVVVVVDITETHKRLKESFLIRRNRTRCTNFRGSPHFQSYVQQYNRKQLNQLILCQFDARRLAGGKGHENA